MKNLFFLTIFVLSLIIISGCGDPDKTPEESSKVEKVTIGMVTFPGYAPLYLAKDKELFDGVEVTLKRIESIGDIRSAMISGNIDMYAATYDIFQANQGAAPPGVGFLAIDESHGGDGVVATNEIQKLEDLKGKTLGAEPGLPPYFILQYLLNEANLTLDDVVFKDVTSQDAGNAFVAKSLDAAGTYEPFLSISAEKRPDSRILVSSEDTPGLIVDWLFASEKLIKEKPEVLKKIANGWFSALDYWKSNQDESMTIMAKAFGVDKAEMEDIKSGISWLDLQGNKELLDKSKDGNAFKMFELVGDILESNNSAKMRVRGNDKLTPMIIDAL